MAQRQSLGLPVGLFLLASLATAGAQSSSPAAVSRVAGNWSSSAPVALAAARPPLSFPNLSISGIDEGAAPASENLSRMVLLLAPSAAQQQALAAEITSLQNPSSPNYHQWLTPAAFASAYANSDSDVAAVVAWLQSQGFTVAPLPVGRGWIEFSGTVAQVEQAFHTQIDLVSTAGGSARPVVMSDISIPAALEPLIAGLVSLDGVVSRPALTTPQPLSVSAAELAAETSPATGEALAPQLAAQLLDLQPLAKANFTGAGQTVAIASRSDVNTADVAAFRSAFGLPASAVNTVLNGADPGFTDGQAEATLAASWVGAAAPGAQIVVVPAATTDATDGVDLSLAAIVDGDLASTVDIGYSACEAGMGTAHQAFYSSLYRQATAEGIAVIAAAGDSGAAACAVAGGAPVSTGFGVNALASTQWDTAVGVAAFGASGPAAGNSALSAWSPLDPADPAYAGGGGTSTVNALPAWQPLPSSLPAGISGSQRLLPDVSLPTAIDSSLNRGVAFCLSTDSTSTGCTLMRSGGSGAAAAYFAGIAALMAQQHGAEGNLSPLLYQLSYQSGIYNDVQQGSAQLKCALGSPGCAANGQMGFAAGSGFDLATGLGVPDANALVRAKPQATGTSPVTVDNEIASGQTINPSGSLVLAATVDSGGGGTVPTGSITFYDQTTGTNLGVDTLTAATGTTSTVQQTITGQLAQGVHSIIAEYSGDSTYAAANSGAVSVSVQLSSTYTTATPATYSPTPGSSFSVTAVVTSTNAGTGAAAPLGTIQFQIDGANSGSPVTLTAGTSSGATTTSNATTTLTAPSGTGSHNLTTIYSGNVNYSGSTSSAVTIGVGLASTTTAVTPATYSPTAGSSLSVTAVVTSTNAGAGVAAPAGIIQFQMDGATVATASLVVGTGSGTTTTSSATTTVTVPTNAGTHSINAIYSGDGTYTGSTSQATTITVGKASTVTAVTPTPTSPAAGSNFTATAVVSSGNAGVGAPAPTGTVVFDIDGVSAGSGLLVAGTSSASSTTSSVTATLIAPATVGAHTLSAIYPGDTTYANSTSPTVALAVAKAATTTTVAASPSVLTPNTPEALTATILPATPAAGPTVAISGTVSFYDGTTLLGQVAVTTNSATLSGVALADNASHSITAVYSGDSNWLASTSAALPLAATTLPVTVVLTANTTSAQSGSSVFLTATVTPNSLPPTTGEQNPTGTVVFYQGTTIVGSAALTPAAAGDASTATLTVQTLPGGQDQLTAYYEGDAYFDPGTSAAITLTVEAFTITPAASNPATNLTIVQGAAGSESFVITGQGGFNDLVQVICTAPAGDNMTCSPTPQQVTPTGTVTFVVQTSTTPLASNDPAGRGPVWPQAAGGAALAGLVFFLLPFGRRARTLLRVRSQRALILLLLLVGLGGAGMGCTNGNTLNSFGTPLGIATFKVTATAYVNNTVVSQNVYFTVNVVSQ